MSSLCIDLLLVLQKLLLLVVVKLLELLELVVLLQGEMSLVLLKVTAYCPLIPLTRCTTCSTASAWNNHKTLSTYFSETVKCLDTCRREDSILTSSHDVGACGRWGHARGLAGDWVPGIGGRQAVQALWDVGVRPDICRGVVEHLVCTGKRRQVGGVRHRRT